MLFVSAELIRLAGCAIELTPQGSLVEFTVILFEVSVTVTADTCTRSRL